MTNKNATPATTNGTGATSSTSIITETALIMLENGYSILPLKAGSKSPAVPWKPYQTTPATLEQAQAWYADPANIGIGVVCGNVSGNLEMLELEGRATDLWANENIAEAFTARGLTDLYEKALLFNPWTERSPSGGIHWYFRVIGTPVLGNTKLAWDENGEVTIETRGEGGFSVIAPTPKEVHPLNKRGWEQAQKGVSKPWLSIPTLTASEYQQIHEVMRALNCKRPKQIEPRENTPLLTSGGSLRECYEVTPGDDFENRVGWDEILSPHGWQFHSRHGEEIFWTRPGKNIRDGHSASTGHVGDRDRLYVWSSSTIFTSETPYTKLGAYTFLNHGGDFQKAREALEALGYGQRKLRLEVGESTSKANPKNTETQIVMRPLSDVTMKPAEYFWENKIPSNTFTVFGGEGGCGKSTFLAYLASKATRGELPGEHYGKPINIGLYSVEDNVATVTAPRYRVNGADMSRVYTFTIGGDYDNPPALKAPQHIGIMEQSINRHAIKVLIIDPVARMQPGNQDKAQDVQNLVSDLRDLATRTRCTIIGVHHTKKGMGVANEALSGSHQWRDSARGVILFAHNPESGESVYQVNKLNGGMADTNPYSFKLVNSNHTTIEGLSIGAGKVEETGISPLCVEAVRNRQPKTTEYETEGTKLANFLRTELQGGGKVTKNELERKARLEGLTWNKRGWTRAISNIGAKSDRTGNSFSYWLD